MVNPLTSPTILAVAILASDGVQTSLPQSCQPSAPLVRLDHLPEASGVAASRRTPGIYWAHNDSGEPVVFALDEQGAVKGRVRIAGARVDDWEDIAVARCGSGWCLYIADIGDNDGERDHITVYRVPEPAPDDTGTPEAEVFEATYPDGAHDAESLFVTADERVFIVTKGGPGPVALFRFPQPLQAGRRVQLQRVGEPLVTGNVAAKDRPTAADVSQDGRWVAVRTTAHVTFYGAGDLTAGQWREALRVDLASAGERRGEGLTFTADGHLVLVGEAGGLAQRAGTFVRLECSSPR